MFERAKELGYNKFTDVALNFRGLVDFVIRNTPADVIVYFLHHTETTDTGKIKAKRRSKTEKKTNGKRKAKRKKKWLKK